MKTRVVAICAAIVLLTVCGGARAQGAVDAAQAQAARAKPQRIRIGGSVQAPKIAQYVVPVYPPEATEAGVSGSVMLHVIIGTDGKTQEVEYVSGPVQLKGAAMNAVKQWMFEPVLLNGEPVEVDTTISVDFTLRPAKLVHQVIPKYPADARKAGITGTVVLKAVIAKDGSVKDLQYVSGPKDLADSAIKAVKKWRYETTRIGGNPVEVETTISVAFTLP